ncbi:MAG: flagellar export chaperone FliS [Deltaproteobacteria bacterium]|nr:flagellar export chaperone FliS [Deltaproteobacteria bacterium]
MKSVKAYQNVQVMTADRVRLIIMLYEGIIRFNRQAQDAIRDKDIKARGTSINRSIAILSELINSLNMEEGGEIASRLFNLYEYSIQQLTAANLRNDPAPIDVVNRIIGELKGGWEGIAKTNEPGKKREEGVRISHGA